MRIALLPTCVVDTVAPEVGVATVRVLRRAGHEVVVPDGVTCCGQPAWNAGFHEEAAAVARTTLGALAEAEVDAVCVPAGSCTTMIRVFWRELFHLVGDVAAEARARVIADRTFEFSELLDRTGGLPDGRHDAAVARHVSCHMLRELGLRDEAGRLLDGLEGCRTVAWSGDDRCCGFGGTFALKQPETSVAMADDKIDSLLTTDATELVGCDQSCLLHLQGRLGRRGETTIRVRHLAEVLDEAWS
ncbi:MAG: (Fe-S)-binding protein [Actinobacteria bacterium]|nr:(Fe-S)-binding protein [Actinomycetota bacterium]